MRHRARHSHLSWHFIWHHGQAAFQWGTCKTMIWHLELTSSQVRFKLLSLWAGLWGIAVSGVCQNACENTCECLCNKNNDNYFSFFFIVLLHLFFPKVYTEQIVSTIQYCQLLVHPCQEALPHHRNQSHVFLVCLSEHCSHVWTIEELCIKTSELYYDAKQAC